MKGCWTGTETEPQAHAGRRSEVFELVVREAQAGAGEIGFTTIGGDVEIMAAGFLVIE